LGAPHDKWLAIPEEYHEHPWPPIAAVYRARRHAREITRRQNDGFGNLLQA
jgi:hypothetical protein